MRTETSIFVARDQSGTFTLITGPSGLRRWLAITARVELRPGGAFRWTILPGHSVRGSYAEVVPGKRVVFSVATEADAEAQPETATVTVDLEPAEGGTVVRLAQDGRCDGLDADAWARCLRRLAEAAASGDAGSGEQAAVAADLDVIACTEAALAVCQRVVRDVRADDRSKPTPCTEYDVQGLADHLVRTIEFFGGVAGAEYPQEQAGDTRPSDLEGLIADVAQVALEAWNARGLGGTIRMRGSDMPAHLALGIACVELLVHAWDFAQALGRDLVVPEPLAGHVLSLARLTITEDLRERGSFDGAVAVGPETKAFDQLLAFTGRNS